MSGYALFPVGPQKIFHYDFQVGGTRFRKSTRETVRARAERIALQAHTEAAEKASPIDPVPTLRKLVSQWLQVNKPIASASYLKSVKTFGNRHLYRLGDMLISEIRTEHVEKARAGHLRRHSRSTANHWLRILRMLTRWAVRRKLIPASPWQVSLIQIQKRPRPILPVARTADWFEAVDKAAGAHIELALVIRLIFGMGLRIMEAVGARWEWIDWERSTYTPGATKGKEADPIPIPKWLVEELAPKCFPSGVIALSLKGRLADPREVRKIMKTANLEIGLHGLTPHRLRGTYATLLSANGVPIQEIQQAMRHKAFATTMGYLEKNLGMTRSAVDAVGEKTGMWRQENDKRRAVNPHDC